MKNISVRENIHFAPSAEFLRSPELASLKAAIQLSLKEIRPNEYEAVRLNSNKSLMLVANKAMLMREITNRSTSIGNVYVEPAKTIINDEGTPYNFLSFLGGTNLNDANRITIQTIETIKITQFICPPTPEYSFIDVWLTAAHRGKGFESHATVLGVDCLGKIPAPRAITDSVDIATEVFNLTDLDLGGVRIALYNGQPEFVFNVTAGHNLPLKYKKAAQEAVFKMFLRQLS